MKFKWLLVVLVAVGPVALGEGIIKVGDPESQVIATLGKPYGKMVKGGVTHYMYNVGHVLIQDGKVVGLPDDFEASAQREQAKKDFAASQEAKGLVLYAGQWVTPEQQFRLEAMAREKEEARVRAATAAYNAQESKSQQIRDRLEAAKLKEASDAEAKRQFDEKTQLARDKAVNDAHAAEATAHAAETAARNANIVIFDSGTSNNK